ncbi:glycoside hydrolase family 16 protein [Rheinheimera riviphila]|uniref:Glycoside hydrolase family 16 protein n=1 Tax=Rheinheimera riviphila TaxID=1834037 RepID=A0A437QT44_9GAMM|nr:glycoside hydrolase family 16 protein [Rheinheimera riviphila]RVU37698.1 glycoside hydrolase family 16 protein [Rheinheimera riviphila]
MKTTMRNAMLCAGIATVSLQGCGGGSETHSDFTKVDVSKPVSDWVMVWNDEFDAAEIDSRKWNFEVNCTGGGNNEKQCYTSDKKNAFISGGMLNIVALPAAAGADKPYTSSRLTTQKKADFKYGRFEMKAKLPSGQGSWPAFWMMPTDSFYGSWPKSGEIDIMEAVNLKVPNATGVLEANVHGTLHYGREWPNNLSSGKGYALPEGKNPADDFHTYAIEWQEGEIRWYVDGYLFATQRQSEVRYNAKNQAVGLKHRGWYTEYFNQGTGEKELHWDKAPFDQKFFMILNVAVGGNWPENVNKGGIDAAAFAKGQSLIVDYVRVYECKVNPTTGKGCETVRPGYDKLTDGLVEGKAPIPAPPSTGIPQNLTIFDGTPNPNWPAWDCCGGSNPALVADAARGNVYEFLVGAAPTVNGFVTRTAFIKDPAGVATPFDASPMAATGNVTFDMQLISAPNNAAAAWKFKVESSEGSTAAELDLTVGGPAPAVGKWQSYSFPLSTLAAAGLDLAAIDVVMIFPAWGSGEGAVYRIDNLKIGQAPVAKPQLVLFKDGKNLDWPMWDCCGGSTPTEQVDDAEHGAVAEFSIGATPTVMGFITRAANGGSDKPFDATAILDGGVVQFQMKLVSAPSTPNAAWKFKVEADGGSSAVELDFTASLEAKAPETGKWQTYTYKLADLAAAGLDVSAIDVVMIFPAWGSGNGAVYRVDNARIYHPSSDIPVVDGLLLFADKAADDWSIWDCCGGSTPTLEQDDTAHGATAQYIIGAAPTVMGIQAAADVSFDASALLQNGVVRFEMKVVSAPSTAGAAWKFKIESDNASSAVELDLSASLEGKSPTTGQWQTYTFPLKTLFDAGLDISAIDVLMVFPAWGSGNGAVYRLDNVVIANP